MKNSAILSLLTNFSSKVFHSRFFITGLALAVIIAMMAARFTEKPRILNVLRLNLFDTYIRLNPAEQKPAFPVVIMDIDEKSLAKLGQFPWPRNVIGQLLESLADYEAAAIGMDAVFPEFDQNSPKNIVNLHPDFPEDIKTFLRKAPDNEVAMQKGMREMKTVLGLANSNIPDAVDNVEQLPAPKVNQIGPSAPIEFIRRNYFAGVLINVPPLNEVASGFGVFSLANDVDGIIRRIPMVARVGERVMPSLSLEVLRVGLGSKSVFVLTDVNGIRGIRVQHANGNLQIPTDEEGVAWVYFGAPDIYDSPENSGRFYISAVDILEKTVPPERLKNAFVLMGASATGLKDLRNTPIHTSLPGVEVHANMLSNILSNDYVQPVRHGKVIEGTLIFILGVLVVIITRRMRFFVATILMASIQITNIGISWFLFTQKGLLYDVSLFTLSLIAVFVLVAVGNYIKEAGEKKHIRRAFQQYLSPDLVDQLSEAPELLSLGGELREMTFLFCDVRGFTTISESFKSNPHGLTVLINRLLTPLTNEILTRQGTIDKYMGDCIMAFWNAPLNDPEHARNAARASLAMFKSLEVLNAEREKEAREAGEVFLPLKVGAGINTGDAVVGNMGSEQRFDYSVLGDSVNLASRLEGQSKTYGVDVVVGETSNAYYDSFATVELDLIAVKGKDEAVRIFALLGFEELHESAEFQDFLGKHNKIVEAYRKQDWDEAERMMKICDPLLEGKLSVLYGLYRERIESFRKEPPGADWDGVFRATSK